ncbi:MAG: PD-(D/E)XK nuclease family protein [Candidatus Omnitrophota bacterium]|nr:PD-(D/E)XK nuclease family protein [Candidatus Omnitrophota bacterium]MBU2528086.1 PD-(D/E)XK nuclease family protein [bacterium]MBU3929712.1 PD-(D/E)XK nuclease family protein [bacterium]MBU4123668.1 PD-(D/E)XK nuclease family protein [bacterium]
MATDIKPVELKSVSASKLRLYLQCPRRYYYAYGEGIFQEENPATRFGSYIHAVIEDYCKALVAAGVSRDMEKLYSAANSRKKEFPGIPETGDLSFFEADVFLNRFASKEINPETLYAVEKAFDIPFYDNEKVSLTGRIDRMDIISGKDISALHIIDYKTGKNELSEEELKADIQMKFYICAAFLLYRKHHKNIRFTLAYLRDGNELSFETSQPEIFCGEIECLIRELASDNSYVKRPGPLCRHCPAIKICKPELKNE